MELGFEAAHLLRDRVMGSNYGAPRAASLVDRRQTAPGTPGIRVRVRVRVRFRVRVRIRVRVKGLG